MYNFGCFFFQHCQGVHSIFDNVKKLEQFMYSSKPEFNVVESDKYGSGEDRLCGGDRFQFHVCNVLLQIGRDFSLEKTFLVGKWETFLTGKF